MDERWRALAIVGILACSEVPAAPTLLGVEVLSTSPGEQREEPRDERHDRQQPSDPAAAAPEPGAVPAPKTAPPLPPEQPPVR